MPRRTLLIALMMIAASCGAQVVVTPYNTATLTGPAYPMTPVSRPLLFAPIVSLGESAPANVQNETAEASGTQSAPMGFQLVPVMTANNQQPEQPFNFGVAQFGTTYGLGRGADLAEVARRDRARRNAVTARTYTNSDIQRLSQQPAVKLPGGMTGIAVGSATGANNGALIPSQPNAVAQDENTAAANPTPAPKKHRKH